VDGPAIFCDPAGEHDWGISAAVDLAASDEEAPQSFTSPTSVSTAARVRSATGQ
jgi:hypothetical protein